MTPAQVEESARNLYNSIGDSFWSSAEILMLMYKGCLDMCSEANLIERSYSTSTVIGQQDYAYPTNTTSVKRVTFAGKKLKPITFREDDSITGLNQTTTATATPQYYFIWNEVLSLRPLPAAVGTLQIYTFNEPGEISAGSTLEIPTQFHMDLVDFVVGQMAAKDSNLNMAQFYALKWEKAKAKAKRWARKKNRGDSYSVVQDEDMMVEGYLGIV